jgi:hypothetical protein
LRDPNRVYHAGAIADVPPTMEWLAESLLVNALRTRLEPGDLLSDPIVYTLEPGTLERYEHRVVVG